MSHVAAAGPPSLLLRAIPFVFVLIWSTGFIVARYGMPHAPPFKFLALRFALSAIAFAIWIAIARPSWPRGRAQWLHLSVTGLLIHASYLGGVWAAVKAGLGAGTVALVIGLQPLLTAAWLSSRAPLQRVLPQQWLGLALGLAGLLLVVWHRLDQGEVRAGNLALALAALAAITIGTLYQKRFVEPCDVRSAGFVQQVVAMAATLPLALLESEPMRWEGELVFAMAWSVIMLTLAGSSLLYLLIERGAATRVTSLMYLVPPCTAVLAWLMFGEDITTRVVAGMAVAAIGVALVMRDEGTPAR